MEIRTLTGNNVTVIVNAGSVNGHGFDNRALAALMKLADGTASQEDEASIIQSLIYGNNSTYIENATNVVKYTGPKAKAIASAILKIQKDIKADASLEAHKEYLAGIRETCSKLPFALPDHSGSVAQLYTP